MFNMFNIFKSSTPPKGVYEKPVKITYQFGSHLEVRHTNMEFYWDPIFNKNYKDLRSYIENDLKCINIMLNACLKNESVLIKDTIVPKNEIHHISYRTIKLYKFVDNNIKEITEIIPISDNLEIKTNENGEYIEGEYSSGVKTYINI